MHNVADARSLARKRVPRALFDYVDGAAEGERTARRNLDAFAAVTFVPRAGSGVRDPVLGTRVLGEQLSMPVVLAPCGLVQAMHPDGAAGAARAARAAGVVSVVSTVAGRPAAEVAAEVPGPLWFQLYAPGGAAEAERLAGEAAAAGYRALVVTIDTPALGNRERDVRHGISLPLKLRPRTAARLAAQVAVRPRWALGMARAEAGRVAERGRSGSGGGLGDGPGRGSGGGLVAGLVGGRGSGGQPSAGRVAMQASPFSWDDVAGLRAAWHGPLLVKGLVTADDARRAVDAGADGVIVSNHGGRQLEDLPATLSVLPSVVSAVGPEVAVLLDGGVRRGSDVVKALALGAAGVLVGRAYLYGLAAAGEAGVERVLAILRAEMTRTLVLLGCAGVGELDPSFVTVPDGWRAGA